MNNLPPSCPYVRRAWYDIMTPDVSIAERIIYDYELIYIKEGHACIIIEGIEHDCTPGDLIILRPMQRNSILVLDGKPLVQPHVHFDLEYYENRQEIPIPINVPEIGEKEKKYIRRDILDLYYSDFPSVIRPGAGIVMEQMLFDVIHAYGERNNALREMELQWRFIRLWQQVLYEIGLRHGGNKYNKQYLQTVRTYLEYNLDKRVSLEELAELVHFSKNYLLRSFREVYGQTPQEYHTMLRLEKARNMVQYTSISVQDIAASLGYDTVQDFSRAFKRSYGCSPSMLRKGNLTNIEQKMYNVQIDNQIVHVNGAMKKDSASESNK